MILEGVSLLEINAMKSDKVDNSWLGHMVADARRLMQSFISWESNHVKIKRPANQTAHLLSQYAINLTECHYWVEEVPSFLESQLMMYLI